MEKDYAQRQFDDAAYAYSEGQFQDAAASFLLLAESGVAMAAVYLAEMYFRGEGVLPNTDKGIQWLERAVSWGNSTAAYNLGSLYRTGDHGIQTDDRMSKKFFRIARELGCQLPIDQYL